MSCSMTFESSHSHRFRGIIQACSTSMAFERQRIMDVVDAAPLDAVVIATTRMVGLECGVGGG